MHTMTTLAELADRTRTDLDDHLDTTITVPVIDTAQAQGDLLVIPLSWVDRDVRTTSDAAWATVPACGVEVVRGVAGGNAHTLHADPGTCRWTTDVHDDEDLAVGVLEATAPAWLLHREHGAAGIAPGRYVVRRQREQAEEQRLVAD